MKNIFTFILLFTTFLTLQLQASFNFGSCSGSGTFEQQIIYYNKNYEQTALVGTIPQGIQGLRISLVSEKDVDIRLYGENEDRIVHWPYGLHFEATQTTKPYKDVNVTYSGYNGVGGKKGHEFIEVDGATPTVMTMKAFGYQAGYATVNYSWTGKVGCTQNPSGTGSFTQTLEQNATSLVGTIPPNVDNVKINLTSETDLDIQLYGADGTAIASWKPTGLLAGPTKQSIIYQDMNITWSGYNGVDGQLGHEYITVTPKTTEVLVMKVYGYQAGEANVTYSWGEVNSDTTPPVITLNGDENLTLYEGDTYVELGASAVDDVDGNVSVEVNGTVNTQLVGTYVITYTAKDSAGNEASESRVVTVEEKLVTLQSIAVSPNPIHLREGGSVTLDIIGHYSDGSYVPIDGFSYAMGDASIAAVDGGDEPVLRGFTEGNTTLSIEVEGIHSEVIPVRVTEELNTSNFNFTNFGTAYTEVIPKDATLQNYDEKRFCMIAGQILAEDGTPLQGVRVSVHKHSEYGSVMTDANGTYAIPAEGGLQLTVRYIKLGYTTIDRNILAPVQDWVRTDDVTMLEVDTKVTQIDLNETTPQIHISTPISDDRGERSTTLVFDGVTKATVTASDGSTRELSSLKVRATEFKTPNSMPSDLPTNSAYTYCSDIKVDGVGDDENVSFDAPVIMYVENFLGFEVGEIVPVGYYDRNAGVWKASDNGVVVKLLDTDGDGKVDGLDANGSDTPNDLNGDGSFLDEVAGIVDNDAYAAGNSYWRAAINHFTPWDHNWPYGPPEDSEDPEDPDIDDDNEEPNDCQVNVNSYVTSKTRVFHEDIPLAGTDITLHYSSKRVDGYKHVIETTVDTSNAPASVQSAVTTLRVGGKVFTKSLDVGSLNALKFEWDGTDALEYGMSGEVTAKLTVKYVYNMVYYRSSRAFSRAWDRAGSSATGVRGRDTITRSVTKSLKLDVEKSTNDNSHLANGWTFSNVHDAGVNSIQKGDGTSLKTQTLFTKNKIKRKLINNNPDYNTVDHWIFNFEGGNLEIDTITEYSGDSRNIDIDNDGISQPVDLWIYVFKKDSNDNWQQVANNDDSSQTYGDGSVHMYDSYLNLNLDEGVYLLAVSNFSLNSSDALSGQNRNKGYPNGGPYEITFNKTLSFTSLPFGSIIENAGNASFSENNVKYLFREYEHITTEFLHNHIVLESFRYEEGYLTSITDNFNNITTIHRDGNGNPTSIVAPNGQMTHLNVDENGDLIEVRYEDNSKYEFTYYDGSLMDIMTDPNGNLVKHNYNDTGRIVEEIDGENGSYQFLRNVSGGETFYSTVYPEGETRTSRDVTLTNGDTLSTMTNATGDTSTATFSADEMNSTSMRDGVETKYSYTTDSLTHQKTLASKEVTLPSGRKQTTTYETTYDGNATHTNMKTQSVTANGKTTYHMTDYNIGMERIDTPEARSAVRHYDVDTLLTRELRVGTLNPTTYHYDAQGRVIDEYQADRHTHYTYSPRGNVDSITDPRGQVTTYLYDIMDRVQSVTYPNNTTEHYEYDNNGNMTKRIVPSQVAHDFSYTGVDLKRDYTSPMQKETSYLYDRSKNLTDINKPSGTNIHYQYTNGRLETLHRPEGMTQYSYYFGTKVEDITQLGERVHFDYDGELLGLVEYSGVLNQSIMYGYNNDFLVEYMEYAGASEFYMYDNDGLLTNVGAYQLIRDTQNGYTTQLSDGTLTQDRSYNDFGEISQVSDNTFGYEIKERYLDGSIKQKEETLNGTSVLYDYVYDTMGRLVEVYKNGQEVEEYSYDANGNRDLASINGTHITQTQYTLDDSLLVYGDNTYSYNEDGYLEEKVTPDGTSTYTYGSLGELKSVSTPEHNISYLHNALNQRVAKVLDGQTVEKYLWKNLTRLLAVYDKDDNLLQRFEYADQRMPVIMTKGTDKYYLHYDQVGSLRAVTDNTHSIVKEIVYDTYGNIVSDSNEAFSIPFGFAGGLYDVDTKLTRFGYRDYDAYTGKWTAKDPIGFDGGDSNLYGYVLGDPVRYFDPKGLEVFPEVDPDATNEEILQEEIDSEDYIKEFEPWTNDNTYDDLKEQPSEQEYCDSYI
ncbi:MAG: odd Oz/ten-m homolog 4 [uncultured Sulfurovum sp.]|uniref:Odd Oz/ten-m homolog 4 n=1 Tax=uncultured Sulfurovum sp. TaxID=269237 RepID=A0A6S6RW46_9BACT|nr:MAG: odd Oz/ten-m homolog 4 [uncultured Sulfurovum sp.]